MEYPAASMRIIAGRAKGRKLHTPKDDRITRPALAKVREAIFSSVGPVEGLSILDVFAGTGSLGLEALSRGAKSAIFIENHPVILKCLKQNVDDLGFSHQAQIFKRLMPKGLKSISLEQPADIIFCDPPYDKNLLNPTLEALVQDNFIDHDSLTIVEHSPREGIEIEHLSLIKQRKYGQTLISYLKKT